MRYVTRKAILAAALAAALGTAAVALDLGDVLKVGGIAWLVKQNAGGIDREINKLLKQREAAVNGATKVVPIISFGAGGFIGAAQVVGVPDKVKTVQAVALIEVGIGSGRAKAYVPVNTKKPAKDTEGIRVKGVGVSAVVDIKI